MRNWNDLVQSVPRWRRDGFQPTYEELKPNKKAEKCLYFKEFPAYLWGIETSQTIIIHHSLVRVSSLPMRNWNYWKGVSTATWARVSSLPMRNWNYWKGVSTATWARVSSLPMRNWNYQKWTSPAPHATTFPAYLWGIETERHDREVTCHMCFQPTYEELKPRNRTTDPRIRKRFKPTYEELKLFIPLLFTDSKDVSSLPMRNWNRNFSSSGVSGRTVSSLPMRNWNRHESPCRFCVRAFPAYLWGIETGDAQ